MFPEMTRDDLLAALDAELEALLALLPRYDEQRWRAPARADGWSPHDIACHLADSTYGLALMALGEIPPAGPLNERGWMDVDDLNEQRRLRNTALPREKVQSRMASAFAHARRAVDASPDLGAPGPLGPVHTRGMWLTRIALHAREHRQELLETLEHGSAGA